METPALGTTQNAGALCRLAAAGYAAPLFAPRMLSILDRCRSCQLGLYFAEIEFEAWDIALAIQRLHLITARQVLLVPFSCTSDASLERRRYEESEVEMPQERWGV